MLQRGFYVSSRLGIFILVLFVMIVLSVGLMAGLIPERKADLHGEGNPEVPDGERSFYENMESGPVLDDNQAEQAKPRLNAAQLRQTEEQPWLDPFLPTNLNPTHFEMWFYPDFYFDAGIFYGHETITIEILETTNFLIVHYKLMNITKTEVKAEDGTTLETEQVFPYDPNQFWVVQTKAPMVQGIKVKLELEFQGSLVNGIVGYYKSTYINADTGIQSWLATTKFQPADARKAFPNFDEPGFKSNFSITLKHWNNFTALSNMPVKSSRSLDSVFDETSFETTPIMSSYLTCFIVTDFVYRENTFGDNITHRIWAAPDRIEQVNYALDLSPSLMDWFRDEYDMDFHLPKLDQVAVPDYPSGATEHWGLITYREARLLYDPTQVGDRDKQRVASIVSHELAHNYFGNAVTCVWWDEIWLNEGCVNFYQGRPMDEAEKDFNIAGQFVANTVQSVMRSDAGSSSRPIVVKITNPDEANAAFDGITYDKGASMLAMMEDFMGADVFKLAIRKYLADHVYGSVTTEDLLAALQYAGDSASLDLNMTQIMDPWFRQMGLPVVTISEEGDNIMATQKRFLNDPTADPDQPESQYMYKWYVPLSYRTRDGTRGSEWLNAGDKSFQNPAKAGEWIKFNNNQTGFYRVNYPESLWQMLADQLESDHLAFSEVERSNLIDDAFNLARADQLGYPFPLDLTKYLTSETSFVPWKSTTNGLYYVGLMMYGNPDYGLWRKYVTDITSNSMNRLEVGDGGNHMEKANAVPTNIRRPVYQYGMEQTDGDQVWNTLWDRYTKTTSGQEKDNILYALTRTSRVWLVNRILDYSRDESKIRSQDFFTLINYLAANPNANPLTWDWIRRNYDYLVDRFGIENRYLGWMVPNVVSNYNTEFKLKEVEDFYAKYPEAGPGASSRASSIASITANISWLMRNEETIVEWLKENVGKMALKR